MSDQYGVANGNRCTTGPRHVMVSRGRDEARYADRYECSCGETAWGGSDESQLRPAPYPRGRAGYPRGRVHARDTA